MRGVKQGDPISALLFIAVMQDCLGDLCQKWGKANLRRTGLKFGISFGGQDGTLMNLRFADDVILLAQSLADIRKMSADFATYSAKYGLRINFSKTKVMARASANQGCASISINGRNIDVLHEVVGENTWGGNCALPQTFKKWSFATVWL